MGFTVLFVCTGNTCRSPMAEAILRHKLESRGEHSVLTQSAGISASRGYSASEGARRVIEEVGLSLDGFRSQPLTPDLLRKSDLILTMTRDQAAMVGTVLQEARSRTSPLRVYAGMASGSGETADIADPMLTGEYEVALEEIIQAIDRALPRILRSGGSPPVDEVQ